VYHDDTADDIRITLILVFGLFSLNKVGRKGSFGKRSSGHYAVSRFKSRWERVIQPSTNQFPAFLFSKLFLRNR
jgi:hypothetical protein